MIILGVDLGYVFCAAGTNNFSNEGWWQHMLLPRLNTNNFTLITKTITIDPNAGYMPLRKGSTQPKELFPKCILVDYWNAVVLNAVGLSGPGLQWILEQGVWQRITKPFVISFMAIGKTPAERLEEFRRFVKMLKPALIDFNAPVAIEINISCPNAHIDQEILLGEAKQYLEIVSELGVPIIIKINALVKPETAAEIARHRACDALDASNTMPFGELPDLIPWEKYYGNYGSPLVQRGLPPGGFSGPPMLPIVANWIREFRSIDDFTRSFPLIGGSGITRCADVDTMFDAGATAISVGSVAITRRWRFNSIVEYANRRGRFEQTLAEHAFRP